MPQALLKLPIIFEDQDLLVLDKPPGLVVNQADTVKADTVQEMMADYLQNLPSLSQADWLKLLPADFSPEWGSAEELFAQRQGIVHRLDKDTSGLLLLAKNPGSLINLLYQFKNRIVSKKYLCLVHGQFVLKEGDIDVPLGRARGDRKKFAARIEGRTALTHYQVLKAYDFKAISLMLDKVAATLKDSDKKILNKKLRTYQPGFSLVACEPKTGRTHQIRVHMKHLQHPLLGDSFYTGRKRAKLDALWCPRQFLHAAEINFLHPRTQKKLHFQAPLASDLQAVLNYFN